MFLSLSVLLLSASILSFEIIVIRLLEVSHWQPFVTLAISTALLGYGLSGSILVKVRERAFGRCPIVYPALAAAAALVYRPVIHASGRLHLDPGLIIRDPYQWLKVGLLIMVLTLPFVLASGSLALPLLERESVGRYYGWNLVGASLGVAAAVAALAFLDPGNLSAVPALLAGLALLMSLVHFHRGRMLLNLAAAAMVLLLAFYPSSPADYGPYKDITYALRLPLARIAACSTGISGRLEVVTAPALRSAAGLSTRYRGVLPEQAALYRSGDRVGTLILGAGPGEEGIRYLGWQTAAAPYDLLAPGARTAIVGFDGGEEAARAILHGSPSPAIIEPDGAINTLVGGSRDLFHPRIFGPGAALIKRDTARSYFGSRTAEYDLIVYPAGINLASAAAGLTGTAENYELTVEGIKAALGNLRDGGMIAITGWNRYPPTGRLKLLALLRRIAVPDGRGNFGGRVTIVYGWSNHTILVKGEPFTPAQIEKLELFCRERGFTLVSGDDFKGHDPGKGGDGLVLPGNLDLRPPVDSRPYPWHSLKFGYLKNLVGETREAALPNVEWGFFFLVMVLVMTAVFALVALVLSRPRSGPGPLFGLYFTSLGLGYMTFEIVLIKRSMLVTGPPAVTAAVVLGSFLVSSGLGSHTAGRMMMRGRQPWWIFPGVILLSCGGYLLIPLILMLPVTARVAALALAVAPAAFAMGFPFPSALMLYDAGRECLVPWAWSLNGYASVIGSSLAGVLAVTTGFGALLIFGAACYVMAGSIFMRLKGVRALTP